MTPEQIAADIQRGDFLKNRIDQDTKELKAIEKRLTEAGLVGPHVPLKDAGREGKQAILKSGNLRLPVRFESDNLITSIPHGSELEKNIRLILDHEPKTATSTDLFPALFKEVHQWERKVDDGQKFRLLAKKTIPTEDGFHAVMYLLKSRDKKTGIVKSKTVIAWKDIETAES
jgi:hypothetical protein